MLNVGDDEFTPETEYPEELKKEFLDIIEKSNAGKALSHRETSMLFFWIRHMDESRFDFTEKYRRSYKAAKKVGLKTKRKRKQQNNA